MYWHHTNVLYNDWLVLLFSTGYNMGPLHHPYSGDQSPDSGSKRTTVIKSTGAQRACIIPSLLHKTHHLSLLSPQFLCTALVTALLIVTLSHLSQTPHCRPACLIFLLQQHPPPAVCPNTPPWTQWHPTTNQWYTHQQAWCSSSTHFNSICNQAIPIHQHSCPHSSVTNPWTRSRYSLRTE